MYTTPDRGPPQVRATCGSVATTDSLLQEVSAWPRTAWALQHRHAPKIKLFSLYCELSMPASKSNPRTETGTSAAP